MKLVVKLTALLSAGVAVVALAAVFGLGMMQRVLLQYEGEVQATNERMREVAQMRSEFQTQVQEWKNVLLRGADAQQLQKYWGGFEKSEAAVAAQARALVERLPDGPSRELVQGFAEAHARMGQGYRQGRAAFEAASFQPAAGDAAVKGMDRAPTAALSKTIEAIAADAGQITARADAAAERALAISALAMLLAVAGVIAGASVFLRRSVGRLARVARAADGMARGDLAQAVEVDGRDEIAVLAASLRDMQSSLAAIVGRVRGNADSVATASAQIAQGNLDLSQRTEQQASALQQTAASMEELGSTVRHNADNARQADQLAQGASAAAARGGEVVGETVRTMRGINERAQKMADIIGVIDSIAFQTNILALNAAVEAARAGEQGRGFAVVAGEVRSLAQRSAQAAKEIKTLISDSVEHVERGSVLVDQAGNTMQEVVASIRRVSDIIGEISAASAEQSSGVSQVGSAVSEMDRTTQQNAALVEQSAAAADSLRQQARQLVDAVAVFRLGGPASMSAS